MNSKSPLVSIIVTSFNYEQFIGQTIESILAQSYQNWELIICDDASTDNSLEIIHSYEDDRITVLTSETNCGFGEVYKRGYKLCKGKYFSSIDSDDYMAPDKIELQVRYLEEHPDVDILGTYVTEIDTSGQSKPDGMWGKHFNQPLDLNEPEHWVAQHFLNHSSVLMKKSMHDRVGLFNGNLLYLPDFEFWLRCLINGAVFDILREELTYYRTHKLNISENKDPDIFSLELTYIICTLLKPYFGKLNRFDLICTAINKFMEYVYPTINENNTLIVEKLLGYECENQDFRQFLADLQNPVSSETRIAANLLNFFYGELEALKEIHQRREVHVNNLEARITHLEQLLVDKETHITHLEQLLAVKETHITHLEQLLAVKETHITHLEQSLQAIEQTKAWQLVRKWYIFKNFFTGLKIIRAKSRHILPVRRKFMRFLAKLNKSGLKNITTNNGPTDSPNSAEKMDWWNLLPFPTHRIQVGEGLWTTNKGVVAEDDIRTKIVLDRYNGSLTGKSIVDLGCLEGGFSVAFARLGAEQVVGIEARAINIQRCELVRKLSSLQNLTFVRGDIKEELPKWSDKFDVVFAAGILYHVSNPYEFLGLIYDACRDFALIDTHTANPDVPSHGCSEVMAMSWGDKNYRGRMFTEFDPTADIKSRESMIWAAWNDATAFWLFEDDLISMMKDVGFRAVEKVTPKADDPHWYVDRENRVLYVCKK